MSYDLASVGAAVVENTALRLLVDPEGVQQIDIRLALPLIGGPDPLFDVSLDRLI
jgi:hypothetical protein